MLLALARCLTAFAADDTVIDWEATGSITLKLADSYDQTLVSGAKITLYQVAEAGSENSLLNYTYTKDFADCGLSLEDLNDAALPEKLAAHENALGLQMFAHRDGTDGFYVCRMRRVKA